MHAETIETRPTPGPGSPGKVLPGDGIKVESLHEIGHRLAGKDDLQTVLGRIVELITTVIRCDSCFVYVVESEELALRASKNPHPNEVDRIKIKVGEGITGWVAKNRKPVAVAKQAWKDPRFHAFSELPEDQFEAFLSVPILSRGRLIGIINVQHRPAHEHTSQEVKWLSTIGFLVGSEIELARLEGEVDRLSDQLETRKLIERAKGILQRELAVDEETAYLTLQRQCRQRRLSMKKVAEAIVLADDVRRTQENRAPQQETSR